MQTLRFNIDPKILLLALLAIITALISLTSCTTPRKAVDVLSRPKNEPVLAGLCSTRYPVRDSIIKGDSVVMYDTLWGLQIDTLISEPKIIVQTKVVPKTVTKTVTIRDTVIRENTAKVSFLNSQIAKLSDSNRKLSELNEQIKQERDGFREQRNKWRLRFFSLLGAFILLYIVKVRVTKKLW